MVVLNNNFELLSKYNKNKLVPFGEFLPLEKTLKSVGLKTITNNYQSYSKCEERDIIELKYNNTIKFTDTLKCISFSK